MKNIIYTAALISFLTASCSSPGKDGFITLFNGKDLTNWNLQKAGGFEVIDGELITKSTGSGTDIYTDKQYSNFILRLEFLLSEVGNSGVFIRRDPANPGSGFEVQLLAPWTPWRDDLHCTGSLYGHVAVTNRPDETTGRWYRMEIKCDRNIVSVSVNDQITTIADIDTVKSMEGKPVTGFLGFQGNHAEKPGQFAKFRNISLRNLDTDAGYIIEGLNHKNESFRRQSVDASVKIGAQMVQSLAELMSGDDPMVVNGARQALFDIVAAASDPDTPEQTKNKIRQEIKKCIKKASSEITADYLVRISGMISK